MSDFVIRPMRSDDRQGVLEFFASMGEESTSFFNVNRGNEERTLRFLDGGNTDHLFWVAECDGALAGLVFIWCKETLIPWLGIGVSDAFQGRHIGKALLTYVIDYAKSTCCGGLALTTAQTNYKAQGLYEKCGFERLGIHHSGEYLYLLTFRRNG